MYLVLSYSWNCNDCSFQGQPKGNVINILNVITILIIILPNNFSKVICYGLIVLFVVEKSLSLEMKVEICLYILYSENL